MKKLTAKQIKDLKPGDKVLSPGGQEVYFIREDKATYAYEVQFPDRAKSSKVLSIYEAPKK